MAPKSARKKRTVGRAASVTFWALLRDMVVGRIDNAIRCPGLFTALEQARLYPSHASPHSTVSSRRSERCSNEHVQRGDSRECDLHVMSAGLATERIRWGHTPSVCKPRDGLPVHSHPLLESIQTDFARQTCRRYHSPGVGCGRRDT
jgi:hypothetical protein